MGIKLGRLQTSSRKCPTKCHKSLINTLKSRTSTSKFQTNSHRFPINTPRRRISSLKSPTNTHKCPTKPPRPVTKLSKAATVALRPITLATMEVQLITLATMGVTLIHLAPTTETTNDNAHHMFTVHFVQNKNTLYNKENVLK